MPVLNQKSLFFALCAFFMLFSSVFGALIAPIGNVDNLEGVQLKYADNVLTTPVPDFKRAKRDGVSTPSYSTTADNVVIVTDKYWSVVSGLNQPIPYPFTFSEAHPSSTITTAPSGSIGYGSIKGNNRQLMEGSSSTRISFPHITFALIAVTSLIALFV
ncbi:Schizosaccharomyces specific protein, predicted GPI anchor [Schizosaccharomyces osmophilus]|uniref:Schizosaccharomyces specific protein, predicted GPI anchor n=1 Tax=Schizosaccharomyces osmophilus TaxID=2545709 RepID=A0AAE9WGI2_9SCHI|nr:Schizosaccharomyces specific protein, predicted GPI anchor [Schizosaccharomyces osmophilus]WBW75313.1 Schizosaccharomyces specific protein, predicted GPI anchor [Schizosaccharomyces osmophilus]